MNSISQLARVDDVKGERRVCLALLADRTRHVLTDIGGRAGLDAELEGCVTVRTEVVSAARFGDRLAVLQPGHWNIRVIISGV